MTAARESATALPSLPWILVASCCFGVFAASCSGTTRAPFLIDMARDLGLGHVREQPPQRQQGPPAMDAAVPVETAEKDRVKRLGPQRIIIAVEHMVELVRIFARDMAERDPGHMACEFGCKLDHSKAAK